MQTNGKTTFGSITRFSYINVRENFSYDSIDFINTKLQSAQILANDLPAIAKAHFGQEKRRRAENPEVELYDAIYEARIASYCESVCGAIYGAGEIAARCIGPKLKPQVSSSFRKLKEAIKSGSLEKYGLEPSVFDFDKHEKILAIRTETAHFSSVFVALSKEDQKTLCFKTLSEDMKGAGFTNILLEDFVSCVSASIENISKLLCISFDNVIFPRLPLDKEVLGNVARDSAGMPIVKDGLLIPAPNLTIRDHLRKCGLAHLL